MQAPDRARLQASEHGSAVALELGGEWRAAVIVGPSGSGKSSLALELMAMGARLVSDDRMQLTRRGADVLVSAPPAIAGLIEARGVGLLRADHLDHARVAVVADLGRSETARLPPARRIDVLGVAIPLVLHCEIACFAAAMLQLLKGGMHPPDTSTRMI